MAEVVKRGPWKAPELAEPRPVTPSKPPAKEITVGKVSPIDSLEELPKKVLDSLLEGLTAAPQDFAIMGMGFVVGYEGMDVMAFLMKPLNDMLLGFGDLLKGAAMKPLELVLPLANLPIQMGAGALDLLKLVGGPVIFPDKHITPAAKGMAGSGTSYYGPPPADFVGQWPPYGITLSSLQQKIDDLPDGPDKTKLTFEQWAAEVKIKVLMGFMGAILAYTITRPGVAQTIVTEIGDTMQAAIRATGEAVPL